MNQIEFDKYVNKIQSDLVKKIKRKRKWRWLLKPIFKIRVKYYILKRKIL